jgi:hypothetical protein
MSLSYNPTVANDGLVLYLDSFNSSSYAGTGTTWYDISGNSNHATLVSSPAYTVSNGGTFVLDGSSNYFTLPNNSILSFSNFTIFIWVKLAQLNADQYLIDTSSNFNFGYGYSFRIRSNNTIRFWAYDANNALDTTDTISSNTWYHIAVSYNNTSKTQKIYINGSLSVSGQHTNSFVAATVSYLRIGVSQVLGGYTKGVVAQAQFYNRELAAAEILQNYNATKKRYSPEENIVGNGIVLNLDPAKSNSYSGIGNTIFDLSGIGNTGTLINGPTFSSLNGGSIVFDGTNDFLTIGDKLDFGFNSFSFSCWINLSSVTGTRCVFSKSVADYQPYRYALLIINNKLRPFMRGNLNDLDVEFDSTLSLSTSTWYHIVCVYERSSTLKLYINNSLDSSASISHWQNLDIQNSYTFKLGSYAAPDDSATYFMQGSISNFTAYNRVLSLTEIRQNYNAVKNRFGLS